MLRWDIIQPFVSHPWGIYRVFSDPICAWATNPSIVFYVALCNTSIYLYNRLQISRISDGWTEMSVRIWSCGLMVKTLSHYGFDLSSSSVVVFSSYLERERELGTIYVLKLFVNILYGSGMPQNRNERFTLVKPTVV